MPTVGSLFAGVGGFDLGMEQAGFEVLWQAEWDKHCQSVLRRHWPDCALYGDVTDVNGAEIAPVDVITFGSPCQDLSVAGKRVGLDGDRSSMFYQAIRIIKEMRNATASRPTGPLPRAVVWENVPGALSSNRGHDFRAVLDSLDDLGSHLTEWAVLDAQHYGVPQRRRRIFLVAIFDSVIAERCPDPLLPVAEGRRRNSAKGNKKGQDVAGTLGGGSGSRGWSPDTDRMTFVPETTGTLNEFDNAGETRATVVMPTIIFENSFRDGIRINDDISHTLPAKMGTGGGNQPHVAQPIAFESTGGSWGVNAGETSPAIKVGSNLNIASPPAVAQPVAFEVREDARANIFSAKPTDVSHCLTAVMPSPQSQYAQLFIAHPLEYAVRRLTPLETERLMGWPDNHTRWTDDGREQADNHRYRQCGNGVASPVAAWIGSHLLPLLEANHEQ